MWLKQKQQWRHLWGKWQAVRFHSSNKTNNSKFCWQLCKRVKIKIYSSLVCTFRTVIQKKKKKSCLSETSVRHEYAILNVLDVPLHQTKVDNRKYQNIFPTSFFPLLYFITLLDKKKNYIYIFPEICFLDRHSLVVLNVTLSKCARYRDFEWWWMFYDSLLLWQSSRWHCVTVCERWFSHKGGSSGGGTRRLATHL